MRLSLWNILIAMPAVMACHPNRVYEEHHKIEDHIWKRENVLRYEMDITDTAVPYTLLIAVRHTHVFPFKNLDIGVMRESPSNRKAQTRYHLELADRTGQWKGDGLGDIWDVELTLDSQLTFNETGTYRYQVRHLMHMEQLPLIMEVGLILEKQPVK